jgi:hypothetical protein
VIAPKRGTKRKAAPGLAQARPRPSRRATKASPVKAGRRGAA